MLPGPAVHLYSADFFFPSFQPLTFLSLGNAYLALKNVSGALEAFRQALKLSTKCPECESSLKLIRCMQFYPFLYNATSSVCGGKHLINATSSPGFAAVTQATQRWFGELPPGF
jgi:hypothetical protein